MITSTIAEHLKVAQTLTSCVAAIESAAQMLSASIAQGGKILLCGNGGSAADAQHISAELVGRFQRERRALPAMALTTDTSILTALGNDYGYAEIFTRQVQAFAGPKDVLIGLTTSGKSTNVLAALDCAKQQGAQTIVLSGAGADPNIADLVIAVASTNTARIQECHILIGHILCDWVETHATLS